MHTAIRQKNARLCVLHLEHNNMFYDLLSLVQALHQLTRRLSK